MRSRLHAIYWPLSGATWVLIQQALAHLRADGDDPGLRGHHDVADLAQATIVGVALAASKLWWAATDTATARRPIAPH